MCVYIYNTYLDSIQVLMNDIKLYNYIMLVGVRIDFDFQWIA